MSVVYCLVWGVFGDLGFCGFDLCLLICMLGLLMLYVFVGSLCLWVLFACYLFVSVI